MSIPKNCNFSDYTHYPDEESPTTDAQMMDYFQNQNTLLKNLCTRLWQPQTTYNKGDIVFSPSMSNGLIAVCSSAGTSAASAAEPTWGALESTVVDGTATWTMKIAYSGDITNTTGTLPISRGGTGQTTAAAARNALGLGNTTGALPIANGGTGLTSAPSMLTNLGSTEAASPLAGAPRPGVTGTLPIANGGTGATTASAARAALGITSNSGPGYSIPYATCSTAKGTTAKVATTSVGSFSLSTGQALILLLSNLTGSLSTKWTLNVNSTGAKNVKNFMNSAGSSSGYRHLKAGMYLLVYDGTQYRTLGDGGWYSDYSDYSDAGAGD